MKKQMSLFIWAVAVFGMSPVFGATNTGMRGSSTADLTGGPAVRSRQNVNYQKYQTRTSTKTYEASEAGNLYYSQPAKRSDLYKAYDASGRAAANRSVRTSRQETTRHIAQRKYYLAHPFFQPLKNKFGSVTDLSYTMNSYKFDITSDPTIPNYEFFDMLDGKWDMKQFSIKEDFSYGITDTIALMAMARFDFSDYKFKWNLGEDDKMDDSNLNVFGAGIQWRFLDNDKWIASASAHYQHQKDLSNNYLAELKGGYKYGKSTIYGLARGWYVDFDGDAYGNGINGDEASMFMAYSTNSSAFYIEAGAGVFSVLDEDWTLNVEGVYGHYDWNDQISVRAAIGWQPNDWVALNVYAKTAVYNSADGDKLKFYWSEPSQGFNGLTHVGTAKIDDYKETSFGIQGILYF